MRREEGEKMRRAEEQKSRRAEEQKSRRAEEQKSRGEEEKKGRRAEEQIPDILAARRIARTRSTTLLVGVEPGPSPLRSYPKS
jgi:hypothetical protein